MSSILPANRYRWQALGLAFLLASSLAGEELFAELQDAGFDFVHFNGASGRFYMAEINSGGGALFDYDNDGDLDIYVVQGRMLDDQEPSAATFPPRHPLPLTDRLYRNDLETLPDGSRLLRFTDVTAVSGLDSRGYGFGVAAGDFDNDGWVDLYITRLGSNSLLRNAGRGPDGVVTFVDVTDAAGADDDRWSIPASFADVDRDGWLDLYVGNYLDFSPDTHKVCRTTTGAQDYCGPTAYPGVPDRLLRNRGPGRGEAIRFEDVSASAGLLRQASKSLGVVAADFNADGLIDFYVANDLAPNQMWIRDSSNPSGPLRFTDDALLAGSAVNALGNAEASMGVVAGDFDGDGDDDLFMTHLVGETNTLFVNEGEGLFEDATIRSGLGVPSWPHTSWGTAWLDYDNDGWLDLMVANGAVKVIEELASIGDPYPFHEINQLFRNRGDGTFEEVTEIAGVAFTRSDVSRALAIGDLDNDGDVDVLVVNNNGPARLLINQVGQRRHWVGLRLVGRAGKRDMLGARVAVIRDGKQPLWRQSRTDGSFAAANDPRILVGLADLATPVGVLVVWPDGERESFDGIAVDRYTTLRQGGGAK